MSKNKQYVGIDMSKDLFDVSYPDGSHNIFENDKQGFRSFIHGGIKLRRIYFQYKLQR